MDETQAQVRLDEYIAGSGSKSIKAALEADRTLDGNCATLRVTEVTDIGTLPANGAEYLAARFLVEIWT